MDLINGIINLFSIGNLFACFAGCALGTLVGVLPGLGPAATLSLLLPLSLKMEVTQSIIMLAGIFYGAQYGGSTTSILVNIPGEVSSVVTCFDGFAMTKQGRAGQALWMAAVSSFIAGTIGVIALCFIGPEIAIHALKFGPPEYFGLIFLSLTLIVSLSGKSIIKGLGAGLVGMVLATVGLDPLSVMPRLNFGTVMLMRGFEIVPVVIGLFGIGEILAGADAGIVKIYEGTLGKMMPRGKELKKGLLASLRGTALGFAAGLLPGLSPSIVTFFSYDLEKRVSKYPEKFGTGVIEGVAAPEACNNATAQGNFVPLFTLGIPSTPGLAILMAALVLHGLQPGPMLFHTDKQFIWTVIGSMYLGNIMLLIFNLPLVGVWARISLIPYKYLAPIITGVCVVGAYSARNTMFDVWVAFGFGILGLIMRKTDWPLTPLVLGFLLGDKFEYSFRNSLSMGGGPLILFTRPIPVAFILSAIIIVGLTLRYLKRVPKDAIPDDSDI